MNYIQVIPRWASGFLCEFKPKSRQIKAWKRPKTRHRLYKIIPSSSLWFFLRIQAKKRPEKAWKRPKKRHELYSSNPTFEPVIIFVVSRRNQGQKRPKKRPKKRQKKRHRLYKIIPTSSLWLSHTNSSKTGWLLRMGIGNNILTSTGKNLIYNEMN